MSTIKYSQKLILNFRDGNTKIIPAQEIITSSPTLILKDFLEEENDTLLFSFTHSHLTTLLELTGVSPYVVLNFDENGLFTGANLSLGHSEGAYSVQVQARHVVILPFDRELTLAHILSFEIDKSQKSEGEIFLESLRRMHFTNPSKSGSKGFIIHRKK